MTKTMWGVVVLIILVAGIAVWKYGVFGGGNQVAVQTSDQNQSSTSVGAQAPAPAQAAQTVIVTYGQGGFSPATVTIHQGDTVKWVNNDTDPLWVASGVHPVHSLYDGTSYPAHCQNPISTTFDACAGVTMGKTWSFTFQKIGSWAYHNHLSPSNTGTVVVTQ